MDVSEEEKKTILSDYLKTICMISNKAFQERVWVRGEGPEVYDYGEAINDYFDDESILDTPEEFGISDVQFELLMNLWIEFTDFRITSDWIDGNEEVVYSVEWNVVVECAQKVIKAFDFDCAGYLKS